MKKAFGILELLVVIIIGIIVFSIFNPKSGRDNPFEEIKKVNTQKEIVDQKVKEIEETKEIKKMIENNLKDNY